jgi:hypothetical protein
MASCYFCGLSVNLMQCTSAPHAAGVSLLVLAVSPLYVPSPLACVPCGLRDSGLAWLRRAQSIRTGFSPPHSDRLERAAYAGTLQEPNVTKLQC